MQSMRSYFLKKETEMDSNHETVLTATNKW